MVALLYLARHDVGAGPHGGGAQCQAQAQHGGGGGAGCAGSQVVHGKAPQPKRCQRHAQLQRFAGAFVQQ